MKEGKGAAGMTEDKVKFINDEKRAEELKKISQPIFTGRYFSLKIPQLAHKLADKELTEEFISKFIDTCKAIERVLDINFKGRVFVSADEVNKVMQTNECCLRLWNSFLEEEEGDG